MTYSQAMRESRKLETVYYVVTNTPCRGQRIADIAESARHAIDKAGFPEVVPEAAKHSDHSLLSWIDSIPQRIEDIRLSENQENVSFRQQSNPMIAAFRKAGIVSPHDIHETKPKPSPRETENESVTYKVDYIQNPNTGKMRYGVVGSDGSIQFPKKAGLKECGRLCNRLNGK